jgi:hypothetical protein
MPGASANNEQIEKKSHFKFPPTHTYMQVLTNTFDTHACSRGIGLDSTAIPTWGDIFESSFKAQSSKLEWLFSMKLRKTDVQALSFEL